MSDFYKSAKHLDKVKSLSIFGPKNCAFLMKRVRILKYFRYFFYDLENHIFLSDEVFRSFLSKCLSDKQPVRQFLVSEYLRKTASKDSKNVRLVIGASRPKDPRIGRSLLETVLELDTADAARLAGFCVHSLIGKNESEGRIIGKLIVKYLEASYQEQAKLILRHITSPIARKVEKPFSKELSSINKYEADGRLEEYEFTEFYEEAFSKLEQAIPRDVVLILEANLLEAIEMEAPDTKGTSVDDYSWMWRPSIAEHEQNYDFGKIKELLVSTLRDALIHISAIKDIQFLRSVVNRYLRSKYSVFKRLALFVMTNYAEPFLDAIASVVTKRKNLEDHRIQHELFGLIQKTYPLLEIDAQQFIRKWIDDGPDTKWWIKWRRKEEGKEPSGEDVQKYIRYWKRDRYWMIQDHDPDVAAMMKALQAELGKPEHPDFPSWHSSGTGSYESPVSLEDLLGKSDEDLIEILKNPPADTERVPLFKHEGLGLMFERAIKENPARFLAFAKSLAANPVQPIFIGHYFRGLREIWGQQKSDSTLGWSNDLNVLASIVANAEPNPYSWTIQARSRARLDLARFIEGIVSNQAQSPGDRELEEIKKVLLAMLGDPDPDEKTDGTNISSYKDWSFLSMNHTSGEVLHALFSYALCYARKHKEEGHRLEADIKIALQNVLTNEVRPSLFSVFGTYLNNLWYLDADWTKSNIGLIFPSNSRWKFVPAWDAYVKFNNVYKDVYASLKPFYKRAIDLAIANKEPQGPDAARLAQHLALAYWRRWEDVKTKGTNVSRFFQKASVALRVSFIRQIGMGLREMKKSAELKAHPEAWTRATELWSWRISRVHTSKVENRKDDELSAYLDWLSSCPEDADVMKDLLSKTLKKQKSQFGSGPVTEYLALQSEKHPKIAVQLLSDLFKRRWDQYLYFFDAREVRKVLEDSLKAGEETSKMAARLASMLGEYGRFEYKDVWDRVHGPKSSSKPEGPSHQN